METRRALLLIADIGGYTEYMQFHRSFLGHAEAATTRLLGKVVDAARDFDLIEIEGGPEAQEILSHGLLPRLDSNQ
jgi:hypothetical protein